MTRTNNVSPPVTVTANFNRLRELVEDVNGLLARQSDLGRETLEAIDHLQEMCSERFFAEEESSLLNDATETMPWVRERVDSVLREHRMLRDQIAALRSCASTLQPLSTGWSEFAETFACFKRLLLTHEQTENRLWQEVYTKEVGTKD